MKKLILALMGAALVGFVAHSAFAQGLPSAKSGAATSDLTLIEATDKTDSWDAVLWTYIKVAEQKELVFDLALQCALYTQTLVKSKGGNKDTSSATATVAVRVEVQEVDGNLNPIGAPKYANPNGASGVVYCSRTQTLSATLQGIIGNLSCFDPVTGQFDPNCPSLTEEEIELVLNTLSANAFNFVAPNLSSGIYRVTAQAEVTTETSSESGTADATGLVGMGSMIVDEVRFTNGSEGTL